MPLHCPHCGSTRVRRSRRTSFKDYAGRLLLRLPYRCRECEQRFSSAREQLDRLRYAHCPRCGRFDLEVISPRLVPVRWLAGVRRALHRRAYRCDSCRWRFFDLRPLAPRPAPPTEEGQAHAANTQ